MQTILNDNNRLRIGKDIELARNELEAHGGRIPPALDEFLLVQGRFATKVAEHEAQTQLVRHAAAIRRPLRGALVEAAQAGWALLPSVGALAGPKPRLQVERERLLLFPHGRPSGTSPGDHTLLLDADTLVSALTDGSALAGAWPPENLANISRARDAFAPAFEEWRRASIRRSTLMTELELLRGEWQESFSLLREAVRLTLKRQGLPNRYASLFRTSRPSEPKVEEESPPPPPPTE